MIGRALRQLLILIGIALVPAAISGAIQLKWVGKDTAILEGEVTAEKVRQWGDNVLFVDVARGATPLNHGVRLNIEEWDALIPGFLDAWSGDAEIVVCGSRQDSDTPHTVAHRLRTEFSLENVWVLHGGREAWEK